MSKDYLKCNEDDLGLDISLKTCIIISQVFTDIIRPKTHVGRHIISRNNRLKMIYVFKHSSLNIISYKTPI